MLRSRPTKQQRNNDDVTQQDETTTIITAHNNNNNNNNNNQQQHQQISSLMVADDDDDNDYGDEEDSLLRNNNSKDEGKNQSSNSAMIFCRRRLLSLNKRSRIVLGIIIFFLFFIILNLNRIIYEISHVEERVPNPFTKAKIFNPFRYIQVKYFDPKPSYSNIKNYTIIPPSSSKNDNATTTTKSASFVINMDRDQHRINKFYQRNGYGAKQYIQRYSAYEWMKDNKQQQQYQQQREQEQYQRQYPFIQHAIREGKYGDAGCFMSHLLLIQEKLGGTQQQQSNTDNDDHLEYISIFEDDVDVIYNKDDGLSVLAPGEADIIFLSPQSATKRIIVPWKDDEGQRSTTNTALRHRNNNNNNKNDWRKYPPQGYPAVRVIGGYGAIGYIVTRTGAQKILDVIATQTTEPLDLSFFTYPQLHVYLPLQEYNIVVHVGTASTRRNINH